MADPSGLGWKERFLGTIGTIGKGFDGNVSASSGVFAYLEVTEALVIPGGGTMDPEVWELQADNVAPGQSTVRLNFTDNPDISTLTMQDLVFNAEQTDSPAGNDTRMFFIGNPASVGVGAFRCGLGSGNLWDGMNRGEFSFGTGVDNIASGARSSTVGGQSNNAISDNAFTGGGSGNLAQGTAAATLGGTNNNIQDVNDAVILGGNGLTLVTSELDGSAMMQHSIVTGSSRFRQIVVNNTAAFSVSTSDRVAIATSGVATTITLDASWGLANADGTELHIRASGATAVTINNGAITVDGSLTVAAGDARHYIARHDAGTTTLYELSTN